MSLAIGAVQLIDEYQENGRGQRLCARGWNCSDTDSYWRSCITKPQRRPTECNKPSSASPGQRAATHNFA